MHPEVYAVQPKMRTDGLDFSHAPPLGSDQEAMAVLHEEILKSACGTEEKEVLSVSRWWRMKAVMIPTVHACLFLQPDAPHIPPCCAHLLLQICAQLVH